MRNFCNSTSLMVLIGTLACVFSSTAFSQKGGRDDFGYFYIDSNEPNGPVYDFQDISSTGTSQDMTDDDSDPVALPFPFEFYGIAYNTVNICSNGFINFPDTSCPFNSNPIPTAADPNGYIAALWDDIHPGRPPGGSEPAQADNPGQGNNVHYQTLGSAPNRVFIIQFTSVPLYSNTGSLTFQYKLFEANNAIEVHYEKLNFGTDVDTWTVGIENHTGTTGLQYYNGSNTTIPITSGTAIRYEVGATINSYDFESGLQEWTSGIVTGTNNFWDIFNASGATVFGSNVLGTPNDGPLGTEHSFIMSPPLGDIDFAVLTFDYFVENEGTPYDLEIVEYSTDGGANWNILIDSSDAAWNAQSSFQTISVDLPTMIGGDNRIRFRYDTVDSCCGGFATPGWFIDNVVVSGLGVTVGLSGSVLIAEQGSTVVHSLTVANATDTDITFDISIANSPQWNTVSSQSSIFVAANSNATLNISVDIPAFSDLFGNSDQTVIEASGGGFVASANVITRTATAQLTDSTFNNSNFNTELSTNGEVVIFQSNKDVLEDGSNADGNNEVFRINTDGTNLVQLTNSPTLSSFVHGVNADGSKIVYTGQGIIRIMDGSGNNVSTLGITGGAPPSVEIAADSNRVVFGSRADLMGDGSNADGSDEIFSINADGSDLMQLTNSTAGAMMNLSVSDDGNVIVFESTAKLTGANPNANNVIYLMDAAGNNMLMLSNDDVDSFAPSVSGNGEYVAFSSRDDSLFLDNDDDSLEVFRVKANGAGLLQITSSLRDSYSPSLSYDGNRVQVTSRGDLLDNGSNNDGSEEIFIIDATSTSMLQLTQSNQNSMASGRNISRDGQRVTFISFADLTDRNADLGQEIFVAYLAGRPFDNTVFSGLISKIIEFGFPLDFTNVIDLFLKLEDGEQGQATTDSAAPVSLQTSLLMFFLVALFRLRGRK